MSHDSQDENAGWGRIPGCFLIVGVLLLLGWGILGNNNLGRQSTTVLRSTPSEAVLIPATLTPERRRQVTPESSPDSNAPIGIQVRTIVVSNLRTGPGLEYAIVEVVPAVTMLIMVAKTPAEDWLELARGSWIWAELVEIVPDALPANTEMQLKITPYVPLRAGPSRFFGQVGAVSPDLDYSVEGRNQESTWLILQPLGENQGAWVRADRVSGIARDSLPIHFSTATPDIGGLFNYLVDQSIVQTEAPDQVEFMILECGVTTAFAQIRDGHRSIVMCQEMLTRMWRDFAEF